jgi:fructokinase
MSIVCFGELLIDFVALESGVSVGEASGFQKAPGGAPANVAVAVARLGQSSAFLGQVGDDPFGHYLAGVLEGEQVDVRGLRFSSEARTALAFVSLTKEGERSFVFYRHPSADMLMRPEDVALEVIDSQRIFHFGSITLIGEPSRSATLMAAQHARSKGLLISYDPNLRMSLWKDAESARAGMLSGLNYAHILKISDEELQFLTNSDDITSLWRDEMSLIVVTHGAGGATLYTRKETVFYPGFQVATVDTTGAGDAFVAALLVGILEHSTPEDVQGYLPYLKKILCLANAAGALTTTKRGAIPALPTRAAVDAFASCPE